MIFDMQANTWRQLREAERRARMSPEERSAYDTEIGRTVLASMVELAEEMGLIQEMQSPFGLDPITSAFGQEFIRDIGRVWCDVEEAEIVNRVNNEADTSGIRISLPVSLPAREQAWCEPMLSNMNDRRHETLQLLQTRDRDILDNYSLPDDFRLMRSVIQQIEQETGGHHIVMRDTLVRFATRYLNMPTVRGRLAIMESLFSRFHQFQNQVLSHIPPHLRPLLRADVEEEDTGVHSEGARDVDVSTVETTGKKVSADDLDELFAEIDELTAEGDDDK